MLLKPQDGLYLIFPIIDLVAAILDCVGHIWFDYPMWTLIYVYINTIYILKCKSITNLPYIWAISLLKRIYFMVAILDFGGHIDCFNCIWSKHVWNLLLICTFLPIFVFKFWICFALIFIMLTFLRFRS